MSVIAIRKVPRPIEYPLKRNNKYSACEGGKYLTHLDVLKMWFNRKVFYPFLYEHVLYSGKPDYEVTCCPMCGWDTCNSESHKWVEGTSNYINLDGYRGCTTTYLCPKCGTHFYVDERN